MTELAARVAELIAHPDARPESVAFLMTCLGNSDKRVPRLAADALTAADASGAAVRPLLLQLLQSANAAERWGAAFTLARLGPPPVESLPILLESLGSPDGDVRWAAADILKHPGSPALPELLALVQRGNPTQRKMALYCLRDLEPASTAASAASLDALRDPVADVRLAALSAIGRLATDRAGAALAISALLDDSNFGVRRAALHALGTLGHRAPEIDTIIQQATTSSDPAIRRIAQRLCAVLGLSVD